MQFHGYMENVWLVQQMTAGELLNLLPRQTKFRAMSGAHLASPIRGELLVMLTGISWAPKFIALSGTKFGAH